MFKRFLLLIFVSFLFLQTYSQENDYFLHTIERGQTVYSIALTYNVSTESIYNLNPGSKDSIKAGERLKIPQQKSGITIFHTIQPKETLYSVSKKYNVTGDEIIKLNPGLSTLTFAAGRTIQIPQNSKSVSVEQKKETQSAEIKHKVEKGETLFSLSQKYNVSVDVIKQRNKNTEKSLRVGETIYIPGQNFNKEKIIESETNSLLSQRVIENVDFVNVVLLFPFGTTNQSTVDNTQRDRIVEYYEGFLLALEDLKKNGTSVNLYVYDIGSGSSDLNKILLKKELKQAHLIIGGITETQIKQISIFSKKEKIKYIIPFSSQSEEPLTNPLAFQINTPQSYLYSKASLQFIRKYNNNKVIFINIPDDKSEKADLMAVIQADLRQNNIPFETLNYNGSSINTDLKNVISRTKSNVFVLSSGSKESLMKILNPLKAVRESNPSADISLFGYPEWQTYTDLLTSFHSLNTSIYSVFYANPESKNVKDFYARYQKWYKKYPINSYPKYGLLGYDTGMYFLNLTGKYGTQFESFLNNMQYTSLQMGFDFDRVSYWGGFINLNIYMVTFQPNHHILREES